MMENLNLNLKKKERRKKMEMSQFLNVESLDDYLLVKMHIKVKMMMIPFRTVCEEAFWPVWRSCNNTMPRVS